MPHLSFAVTPVFVAAVAILALLGCCEVARANPCDDAHILHGRVDYGHCVDLDPDFEGVMLHAFHVQGRNEEAADERRRVAVPSFSASTNGLSGFARYMAQLGVDGARRALHFKPRAYVFPNTFARLGQTASERRSLARLAKQYLDGYRRQGPSKGLYWGDTATPHLYFLEAMFHVASNDHPSSQLALINVQQSTVTQLFAPPFPAATDAQKQRLAETYIVLASFVEDQFEQAERKRDAVGMKQMRSLARRALIADEGIDPIRARFDMLPCYLEARTVGIGPSFAPCNDLLEVKYETLRTSGSLPFDALLRP